MSLEIPLPPPQEATPTSGEAEAKTKCDHGREEEPLLGRALFRVVRFILFAEPPLPALDALPMAQLRLLWTVHYGHDATMKDFSERLGVSQSTVTQLAEQLVRRGLIERHADTNDRRVVRLRTSETGRQILGETESNQRNMLQTIWEAFSDAEQDAVVRGLDILGNGAEAYRVAQGHPAFLKGEHGLSVAGKEEPDLDNTTQQPVLDLMARRVRGRISL